MTDVLVVVGVFREVLDADTRPRLRYGGSGLTASVAAGRLGSQVALASYVGAEDQDAVRAELALAQVDDRAVISASGASGTFMFPTQGDPGRPWPIYRPAEGVPTRIPKVPKARFVLVFGVPDYDPVQMGWLGTGDSSATLIWDRQGWLSRDRDAKAFVRLEANRRIYPANELESVEDADVGSFAEVESVLPPDGFDVAVVKQGKTGVVVYERDGDEVLTTSVPAFPVPAESTIGSGDVFAGVLAAHLARGETTVAAAKWACAAAAVALRAQNNLLPSDAYVQMQKLLVDIDAP